MSGPTAVPSLAHPSIDPRTLVARVQDALGWSGSDFLVGLRGYAEMMSTMEEAHDVEGLARVGDASSPPLRLLRGLNASRSGLAVTRVASVAAPWRWARLGEGTAEITGVALRQQTYLDVVDALGRAGVTFRVLPDDAVTEELLARGAELGSVVADVDELPADAAVVPGYLDHLGPLTYGLVSRRGPEVVDVVWLALNAAHEAAGTLMVALQQFSDLDMDLDFLHSDPQPAADEGGGGAGVHDFYVGFHADDARVAELTERLREVGFTSRVLAAFARPPEVAASR